MTLATPSRRDLLKGAAMLTAIPCTLMRGGTWNERNP